MGGNADTAFLLVTFILKINSAVTRMVFSWRTTASFLLHPFFHTSSHDPTANPPPPKTHSRRHIHEQPNNHHNNNQNHVEHWIPTNRTDSRRLLQQSRQRRGRQHTSTPFCRRPSVEPVYIPDLCPCGRG
ncbi:hypothetical protein BKA57DRAFT_519350 [Linnemannia elongata]|nr:hypothetical protein BKA57DRAFT_519350 [Linnemannia elongata]